MIVTGAFLASSATAVDGKLFVEDGVHTHFYQAPAGYYISTMLVVLTQAERNERPGLTIPVSIVNPAGERADILVGVPDVTRQGTYAGFVIEPLTFGTPHVGRYLLTVDAISIPIEIVPANS